jgi:hypothetical protein
VELVKSEKEGNGSVMLIHLGRTYCFDWYKESINQHNLAIHYARQVSAQFAIEILDYGIPIKRPHIAFEQDLIAHFIAASHTAEIKTREGEDDSRAWIDSSNMTGELETNDDDYSFDYLMMPKTVREIADTINAIRKQATEYERHYHPHLTINN